MPDESTTGDAQTADLQDASPAVSDQRLYTPLPGEAQLTARAVIAGCLVGSIVSCTNLYIALKIGWSFGASIIAAVLGFSFFALINRRLSVLETNIAQTAGSAAGYMSSAAGLVAAIPALDMITTEALLAKGETLEQGTTIVHALSVPAMILWALAVSFLGVFYAVPLRRQVVEVDKLRFPTGTATAETILAMFSEAAEAMAKARVLIYCGLAAGLFTLASHFLPALEKPPVHQWLQQWMPNIGLTVALTAAAAWSFQFYFGPSLLGAGFLIGPRVVLSLLAGAIIGWALLGPFAQANGWAAGDPMDYKTGARGWILWPGVALMVCEALTSVALSWRTFMRTLRVPAIVDAARSSDNEFIPNSWWIGGLAAGSILTISIAQFAFAIPWYLTIVAIMLSAVLANVGARSVGETDINPVGGMGKVTQLVFGGLAPGQMTTNLMAAAITGGGASQAADMMQDLKTGYLLRAAPRKQFLAQLCGICAGIFFAVPIYFVLTKAYPLGGDDLPAPAAFAWKAMAELLAEGLDALPQHAAKATFVAGAVGVMLPILRKVRAIAPYVPSGLAMGIAFIIPAYYSLVMFYGMVIWFIWRLINPTSVERFNFAVASGLIAGEGLMGIVNAGLTIAGIDYETLQNLFRILLPGSS